MSGSSGWQPVSTTILTIGGVYKDFPGNTTVQNRIYVPMDQLDLLKSSWQMYANEIYVTLDDPLNKGRYWIISTRLSISLKAKWVQRKRSHYV